MYESPQPTLPQLVDPATTALVVIDVQNDFVFPNGACGTVGDDLSAALPMIERLKRVIEAARRAEMLIVFVRTSYDEPVLSPALAEQYGRRGFSNSICLEGTWGAEFVDGIGPSGAPNEVVVTKHRYSAFWGSSIDLVLRSNGIKTLAMTGIATEICVESTARDGFFRDYEIVEIGDCASTFSEARHRASQTMIARSFGRVVESPAVIEAWASCNTMDRGWQPAVKAAKLLRTLDERIDPAHTALVLIDVQNDFCDERGAAGQRGEAIEMIKATVPRIRTLLDWARRADAMVIHVKAEYGAMTRHVGAPHRFPGATREGAVWTASAAEIDPAGGFAEGATEVCRAGTRGAAFVDGIVPQGAEQVVIKHRFSGFTDTRLDLLLRSNGIKTIVVAGVTTNCCVESTVRDAAMRDFYIVVAADGVATKDMHEAAHRASLETMGIYFAQVRPSAEIIESWRKHAATGLRATA